MHLERHLARNVGFFAIACGLIGYGCADGPSSTNTPAEMYVRVLGQPIPEGVSNLQGVGDTWQGYRLYLRFNADDAALQEILATGYEPTEWDSIEFRFDIPDGYDKFSPSWTPHEIQKPDCYEANVSNDWTGFGMHFLVVDPQADLVYFFGIGS